VSNRRKLAKPPVGRRRRRLFIVSACVIALVAAGLIGWAIYRSGAYATPAGAVDDGLVLGNGAVAVDVYIDLASRECRDFDSAAGPMLNEMVTSGKIELVYHPIATSGYATRAGAALAAAAGSGKLAAYLKALYAAQPLPGAAGPTNARLIEIAASVGITDPSFAKAVNDGRYEGWIEHVTKIADRKGIRSGPVLFVDGDPVPPDPGALQSAVGLG
jgi:protein-disulfide isomerase